MHVKSLSCFEILIQIFFFPADNTRKQPRLVRKTDFRVFNTSNSNKPRHHLSPQLKIAALRHLASSELFNFYPLQHFCPCSTLVCVRFVSHYSVYGRYECERN